jgi:hypothetical protein
MDWLLVYQLVEQHMANNCVTVLSQHPWLQSKLLIITVAYQSKQYEQHTRYKMCEKIKQWHLQSSRQSASSSGSHQQTYKTMCSKICHVNR